MKRFKLLPSSLLLATLLSANLLQAQGQPRKPSAKDSLQVVAALDVRPGNVAVSANGRVFSSIHPLGSDRLQLIEIKNGQAYPYPDLSFQKNGQAPSDATLDTPLGVIIDKKDRLWVIDMGLQLGRTRLWCFDLRSNTLLDKIEIPANVAPKGSFLQDVVIDEKNNWAYMADITQPGIIALDLRSKQARRFSGPSALQSEDKDMIIDGQVVYFGGKPARVAIDPITISEDRETLFFGAMNGTTWYKIPARFFRENKPDAVLAAAIEKAGNKPFSDGAFTDAAGNHYFTNLQEHAISQLSKDGKLHTLIHDSKLIWPDNVYRSSNGWFYVSVNQLNSTPAFTGKGDLGHPPFYIYRFRQP